jgi:hypothetical protein
MLFDLRGRRRRAVQGTYLLLAVLMGGGLVFFGVGGNVGGGLLDAFKGDGGGSGNDVVQKRIDRNEKRLAASPTNTSLLKALVRDNYAQAVSKEPSGAVQFPAEAKGDLRKAGAYWQRYLKAEKGKPDASLASVARQIYDIGALAKPADAQRAMEIVAAAANDTQSYLQLVQYAALAGDTRTADLETQKAVDLAPKKPKTLRKQVKQQAEQLKQAAKQQQKAG